MKGNKMKKNQLKASQGFLALGLLSTMLLMGCAKELPIQESSDLQDNVIPTALFSEDIEIETTSDQVAASQDVDLGNVIAVNESKLIKVNYKKGPAELASLFKDLRIEGKEINETYKVRFQLSNNFLVAYIKQTSEKMSLHASELAQANFEVPIFQYSVEAYGIKKRQTNGLGEETRTIEFKTTNRDAATHLRINTLVSSRKLPGLFSQGPEVQNRVYLKNRLENRIWRVEQVRKLVRNNEILKKSPGNNKDFKDDDIIRLKINGSQFFIYRPIAISELSEAEEKARRLGLPIRALQACDERTARQAKIELDKCMLRLEYKIGASSISLKRDLDDDGLPLATTSLDSSGDHNQTRLVRLDSNSFEEATTELAATLPIGTEEVYEKATAFDMESEYLYVPQTHSTPREVVSADPFYQGDEKIVILRWAKEGLKVYQADKDSRFSDNDMNNSPVLTIPGRHVDYLCNRDRDGLCNGGLSEDSQKPWQQRRFFVPDLAGLNVQELNTLNIFTVNDGCANNTTNVLTHKEIKKGLINVELRRTFEIPARFECIIDLFEDDNLKSASFDVKYFYSIVRLSDLASPDYKSVDYPVTEQDDFGFFKTEVKKLNDIFDPRRPNQSFFLHRFNSNKKVITYKLSSTFSKPENLFLKDATFKAIEKINKALVDAEAGFEIKLEGPSEFLPGDLRVNSIVLIDEPLSNGLLGYGPSVTNPRTGEIIQAHTNMYSGVLRTRAREVYNSMVALSKAKPIVRDGSGSGSTETVAHHATPSNSATSSVSKLGNFEKMVVSRELDKLAKSQSLSIANIHPSTIRNLPRQLRQRMHQKDSTFAELSKKSDSRFLSKVDKGGDIFEISDAQADHLLNHKSSLEKTIERYSKHCAYHVDFLNFNSSNKGFVKGILKLPNILNEDGTLKAWEELPADIRKQAADLIVAHSYSTTLIHELGHNLGLRHNFIGSADQANFYSEEESKAMGLSFIPQYSSIMDYGAYDLNELPVFGKYDIAALRFGYARKVEDDKGEIVSIPSDANLTAIKNSGVKIKNYEFCTDENAGLSVKCNRFDEGTSIKDIAQYYIDNYKDSYETLNKRDGRLEFSTSGMSRYVMWRSREFKQMRRVFEEMELFGSIFGHELMEKGCSPEEVAMYPICKDINDRRDAAKLMGEFFLGILKTPDHVCALAKKDAPTKISEMRSFAKIYERAKYDSDKLLVDTCFDQAIKDAVERDNLVVVAESGKSIISYKGRDPNFKYKSDIDVRGVWADKILALRSLTTRQSDTGSTEDDQRSYVEHTQIAQGLGNVLEHIILGTKLNGGDAFTLENGRKVQIPYSIHGDNYIIPEQSSWYPIVAFGLPFNDSALLNQILLRTARRANLTSDPSYKEESETFANMISVIKKSSSEGLGRDTVSVRMGTSYYAATEENTLARLMISSINAVPFLEAQNPEDIVKVIQDRMNPSIPDNLSDEEKVAMSLELDLLEQIKEVTANGVELKLERLVAQFGEETGKKIFTAHKLGVEGLEKLIEIKKGLGKAPSDATAEIKALYALDLEILKQFATGTLETKVEDYKKTLLILPLVQ